MDSIKTPAASSKSSQPGNRRLNNNNNEEEDDDQESEGEDGYGRLVSHSDGGGGGVGDSPEITFNVRVNTKLRLDKKTFALSGDVRGGAGGGGAALKKNIKKQAAAPRPRTAAVNDDKYKGVVDRTGLVHIVPQYAADSQSDGEGDEENFSDDDANEGFTWA